MFSGEDIEKALQGGWKKAQTAIDSGVSFVQDSWNRLPFFASVEAEVQKTGVPHEETHYFLIPYRLSETGYTLYSTRRLPEGFAEANDLPKRRVFHLPGPGGEEALRQLIVEEVQTSADDSAPEASEESWGQRLNALADEIDRHSQTVTGGVILIGGLVALLNPVVGAGIAAKAILPSVGALLSREGLRAAGSKLTNWRRDKEVRRRAAALEAEAQGKKRDLDSHPVHSVTNPILQTLEKALATTEAEYDPLFEFDFAAFDGVYADEGTSSDELRAISARAVLTVYRDLLEADKPDPESQLGAEDRRWLRTLEGFVQ